VSAALRARVDAFLQAHHVMTLATVGEHGPWAAAVFYAHRIDASRPELVFLSSPRSRHAADLARDARVAVTIQRDYEDWPEISGVQAEGRVERLDGEAREHARTLYAQRFPLVARAPARIAQALARVDWYRMLPARMYLIDNRLGFGHRDEVDLG
jgi:uncharacterized protein YhbP (UPF0306 family)